MGGDRFVGRESERKLVRELLSTRQAAPFVIHVQGIPGSGKSALLDVLSSDARALGYAVHAIPRDVSAAKRAQEIKKALVPARKKRLVVADDWDDVALDEAVLLEKLERVTGPVVLLVASHVRPSSFLAECALFPDRVRMIELDGLSEAESVRLLAELGVARPDALRTHAECDGLPFALLVAASMPGLTTAPRTSAGAFAPTLRGIAVELVRRLVGQIDDSQRRAALQLLGLTGGLNERELRLGLDLSDSAARSLFDWLRTLTIVRTTDMGLSLVPLVSSAVIADLHLRDPVHARALVASVLGVIEASLGWSGIPRARALSQLRVLTTNAPQDPALAKMFEVGSMRVTQARERDHAEAFALIEELEGSASRAIAEAFTSHDPTSMTIVRGQSRVDGVMIRVELRGRDVPGGLAEPAINALIDVLDRGGELAPGVLVRVTRFFLARGHHQAPCIELGALGAAMTHRTLDTNEPFVSVQYLDARAVDSWRGFIQTLGFVVREDAAVEIDGRNVVPCVAHLADPGQVLLGVARRSWAISADEDEPAAGTDGLEEEIVRALCHMRDTVWLRTSALAAHLFGDRDVDARAALLQAWLIDSIAATETMRRGELVARALRASFETTRSIEEAASVAHMAPSTLKRYRKLGIQRLAELARQKS